MKGEVHMTKIELILANIYSLESALKTLGYAMEFTDYLDDKVEMHEVCNSIAGCIRCILSFQDKISDDMEDLVKDEMSKNSKI